MGQLKAPRRLLVLEDEPMIAMLLEYYISDMGHQVAWQAETIVEALGVIEGHAEIDAALLDMNIRGETSDAVAEALKARRIPFCFITGYGSSVAYADISVIGKPFDIAMVQRAVNMLLANDQDSQV